MRKLSDDTMDRVIRFIIPFSIVVIRMIEAGYTRERIHELMDVALDEYENPTEEDNAVWRK